MKMGTFHLLQHYNDSVSYQRVLTTAEPSAEEGSPWCYPFQYRHPHHILHHNQGNMEQPFLPPLGPQTTSLGLQTKIFGHAFQFLTAVG